jgi:prevent-host-death family protein
MKLKSVGLFEAKAKLSALCDEVVETNRPLLITRRGKPLVRIEPARREESPGIWSLREAFIETEGPITEDLRLPKRAHDPPRDPLG